MQSLQSVQKKPPWGGWME